ncbi:hypothetical protein X291_01625 [Oenococcus oeni IOEB_C23]|uniref:hypothetical protein n=1 Tax=Oenococcus oeni TaxID=1247 RepID=UPI00050F0454|nr:hypothetical protein [Oenococcus oeni]KGH67064.1 hypothetical protein X291_01625 [Oenococcus oeni IOEB_C23]
MDDALVKEIKHVLGDENLDYVAIYLSGISKEFKIKNIEPAGQVLSAKLDDGNEIFFEPKKIIAAKAFYNKDANVNFVPLND